MTCLGTWHIGVGGFWQSFGRKGTVVNSETMRETMRRGKLAAARKQQRSKRYSSTSWETGCWNARGHARKSCAHLQVSSFTKIPSYCCHAVMCPTPPKEASCGVLMQQMVVGLTPASECESAYAVCACVCTRARSHPLPSCLQTTAASSSPQPSLQIDPHTPPR